MLINFNPRSRVGNDTSRRIFSKSTANFNPRSRVGNDIHLINVSDTFKQFQSTFPRGERPDSLVRTYPLQDFNPRSRVGNDDASDYDGNAATQFQSTFPRGERRRNH